MGLGDKLKEGLGITDPRTLRVLRPGVDYHSRIFVDFYPFNQLFQDLLIPPIYVSSGKLDFQFEQRTAMSRTLGAVICDDWGVVNQRVSASGIECIFDAWEVKSADVAGFKVDLPIGLGSVATLNKQGLQTLANMIRTGVYDDINMAVPKQRQRRWAQYWQNRGIFLLDLFLTHYKSNATLFDEHGMPVLSGHIVIETDYTVGGHPSETADYQKSFNPVFKAIKGLDGGLSAAAGAGAALLSAKGFNPDNDYENQIAKYIFQDSQGIHPQTLLYGKFTSLDFDLTKPFQSTLNFQFEVINSLRTVASPEEGPLKNLTQRQIRGPGQKAQPKFASNLNGHEMVV